MRFPLSIVAPLAVVACTAAAPTNSTRTAAMPSDSNKQLVRRLYEDYINNGRLEQLGEIISIDFVGPGGERGPEGFATVIAGLRTGFPDIRYTVEDVVGDGDRVAVRWTLRGTHTGPFRGFAATGKPITNTGFGIFQIADGKLVRAWIETDRLGFLQAIDVIPPNPGQGVPARTAR